MRMFVPLMLTSALLVSACGSATDNKAAATKPVEAVASTQNYQCDSGETIVANYPSTDSVTVKYKGSDYVMKIAVSGSGARYVSGDMEWWTKGSGSGSEGTLFTHMPDGSTGKLMEHCKVS